MRKFFTIVGILLGLLLVGVPARAQNLGVTLTPLKREVTLAPGKSINGAIDITNLSDTARTLYPLSRDFQANDNPDSGSPQFLEKSPENLKRGLASWISFTQDKLDLGAKQTASLNYTIKVPDNAEPGGHYGAVFLSTTPSALKKDSGVALSARFGSLLLLTVSGEIKAEGKLVSFTSARRVFGASPALARIKIANTGNIHLKPAGTIEIKDWRGKLRQSARINAKGASVLPDSQRVFEEELQFAGWGRFRANLQMTLDAPDGSKLPVGASAVFWILPLSAIAWSILALLIAIGLFRLWLKRHDTRLKQKKSSAK